MEITEEKTFDKRSIANASTFISKRSFSEYLEGKPLNWIGRLRRYHPSSLLVFLTLDTFIDGFNGMRQLAMQNIYKEQFGVEASSLQTYRAIIAAPILFRMIFGIIVDSKIIEERKYYLIFGNALAALPMYLIASGQCYTAGTFSGCMFLFQMCH